MKIYRHESDFEERLFAILGLGIGLILLSVGVWAMHRDALERARSVNVAGRIVDEVSRRERDFESDREVVTYAPVVEFVANGDSPVRFTGAYDSDRWAEGREVVVRYEPSQPGRTARVVQPLEDLAAWGPLGFGAWSVLASLGRLLPVRLAWKDEG